MKLAVMQPYFFPYIGYFQLIAAVDRFIVYDNIKYTKKGWINRNRMLVNGREAVFSLPLKDAPDHLEVRQRELAGNFEARKLLNRLREAYRKAPFFEQTWPLLERCLQQEERNLFAYLLSCLRLTCSALGIVTPIARSSDLEDAPPLRGQERVIALCEKVGASTYINAPGGVGLYERGAFSARGIDLRFLRPRPFEYAQLGASFVPWLSIIDVMMFNAPRAIAEQLASGYDLV